MFEEFDVRVGSDGIDRTPHSITEMAHGFILYVVAPDTNGPSKIGITANITRRMHGLQAGCWLPLKVHGFRVALPWKSEDGADLRKNLETGAKSLEREVHKVLRGMELGLAGEWFDVTPDEGLAVADKCGKSIGVASLSLEALSGAPVDAGLDRAMALAYRRMMKSALAVVGYAEKINKGLT